MKPWIRLVIAVVVLAAVAGVLYWPKKPVPPAAVPPPLVKLNPSDVQRITITQPNQPATLLAKSGADWKLEQPYVYPADTAAVSGLLDALGNITNAEDVGSASGLAAFGLDHPSTVDLGLANGQAQEFQFGGDSPTGGNTYLRVGAGGAVKMVPSDVKTTALASPFGLQDKAILHFPSGKVTALDVTAQGKRVHLDQVKSAWPKDQASNVQSLLDALQDGQMTAMPDPTGKAAAADGLTHPTATLRLIWDANTPGGSIQLEIGAKKGAAEYYARNSTSPAIFTLSDYLFTDLQNLVAPSKSTAATPSGN